MDNDLGTLSVGIALDTAGLAAGLSGARDLLGGFAGVAASALIGVGVATTTMAGNFEQGVNRLRTGAGDAQDSFASLSSGILKVSTATGEMSGPLTKAMYEILSSNQRGAQAFDTLAAAAKGAQIEQANVVDVSDTLTGSMTNFGTKVFNATDYMNGLVTAVSRGKITLQDLSTAMGPIEPVAHAMGVSFSDLSAAMSTQTNAAIPAERAATGLRFMMQSLEVPTKKAKDAMTEWGLSSVAVADEMKVSLPGALQMIYDAAKRAGPEGSVPFDRAISDMVGGQRSLGAFLALTGDHMKAFKDNADAIAASMKSGAGDVQGWALAQRNFNVKMDEGRALVEAVGIKIGTALLPVAGQLYDEVSPLVQRFSDWAGTGNNLQGVLTVIGGVIQSDVVDPAIRLYNAVAPIITDFEKWNEKTHFLQNTLQDVGGFINTVAGYVANNLVPPIRSLIGNLEQWLTKSNLVHDALGALGTAVGIVSGVLGTLVGWVSGLVGFLTSGNPLVWVLAGAITAVGVAIAGVKTAEFVVGLGNALSAVGGLGDVLPAIVTKLLPNLAGALGIVSGAAPVAATQLSLFTAAELSAATGATAVSTGLGAMAVAAGKAILAFTPYVAVIAGVTVAAEGLRQGLSNVVAQLLHIPPAAMPAQTEIFALGGTLHMLTTTVKTESHTQAEYYQNMLENVHGFTTAATTLLQGFGREGVAIMQSMDKSTQLYWNNIAGYLANAQSALDSYNANVAQDTYNAAHSGSGTVHMHASGAMNLPAGVPYIAGERGAELIYPSGGTNVYTASQTSAMMGGGQSGGPTTIVLEIDGRQFAAATVEHIAPAIVNRMRLRTGMRV